MASGAAGTETYVLSTEAVRTCISVLLGMDIHQFFPMYLHLRRQSMVQGTTSSIKADFNELGMFLSVPEGPYGRPYFRPCWFGQRNAGQEWMNKNLAGSYAPSSLRNVPLRVVQTNPDSSFSLPSEHWKLAREHLLFGDRVPLRALAGFFLRNFALESTWEGEPNPDDLSKLFLLRFGYVPDGTPQDREEIEALFEPVWTGEQFPWFTPWSPEAEEQG